MKVPSSCCITAAPLVERREVMLLLLLPLKQVPVLGARAAIGKSAAAAVIAHEGKHSTPETAG